MRRWTLRTRRAWIPFAALLLCGAGLVIFFATRSESPNSLKLPESMCGGLVDGKRLQVLLGPGKKVPLPTPEDNALKEEYGSTRCTYEAVEDRNLYRPLFLRVSWKSPDKEPALASETNGTKPKTLHGNKNVYYLNGEHRLFIPCAPELPDVPRSAKRVGYLRVSLDIEAMDKSGVTPREAREAGLKTLLRVGREMEKRAECAGPSRVPRLTEGFAVNWPAF